MVTGSPFRLALILLLGLGLAGCTPAPPPPRSPDLAFADHPLVDRIWSVAQRRFLNRHEFLTVLAGSHFIILGEAHDNPRHHELQAWVLRAIAEQARFPAVAMEMIGEDQAGGLRLFYAEPRANADKLPFFLNWAESGWPDWTLYAPVANTAVRFQMPLAWANFSRGLVVAMHDQGWAALPPETRTDLALPPALPAALRPALIADIADNHCGSLPPDKIEHFAQIQFARDALMARRMMDAATDDGAVLITGAGHARTDRGVPYHLERLGARSAVASVGFVEVATDKAEPQSYELPFDLVWFTPGLRRADPCETFRARR
ncbi:MAG: hypothetical protein D6763_00155 [Alphaproteobacteria bacterium]|nr:MAG: hypothetical protein D6763_00155 [Alphaproteobacteria bacterium]